MTRQVAVKQFDMAFGEGAHIRACEDRLSRFGIACDLLFVSDFKLFDLNI